MDISWRIIIMSSEILLMIVYYVFMLLAISLAISLWGNIVERALDYLEDFFSKKVAGRIWIIIFFAGMITIIIKVIMA